jgi:Rap1a immunity proteins
MTAAPRTSPGFLGSQWGEGFWPCAQPSLLQALPLQAALAQPAQEQGSAELVRQCKLAQRDAKKIKNAKDLFDSAQCLRYIEGFVAGASTQSARPFCVPNATRIVDEVNSYVTWMDKHQETLSQPKHVTLLRALRETYPCRNN